MEATVTISTKAAKWPLCLPGSPWSGRLGFLLPSSFLYILTPAGVSVKIKEAWYVISFVGVQRSESLQESSTILAAAFSAKDLYQLFPGCFKTVLISKRLRSHFDRRP